jgi:hypothetical protein
MIPTTTGARRRVRLLGLLVLSVALAAGPTLAGRARADPSPALVSAPGAPSPTPTAVPSPTPTGVPSPIPTPPAGGPTPAVPSSPPTSAPSPGPSPSPAPTDAGDDEPGLFDIPGQIRKAINEFLLWVAKTGLQPVMNALGTTALSTPDITGNPQVKVVWTTSLIVANGIYVLFVVLGGFILASRETLQSQYGFKQIAPRLAVGAVVSNISLILCGKAIEATNALTAAIAGQEVDGPNAAQAISGILDQPLTGTSPNILLILLVIAVAVLGLVVVITFILRVALLVLLFGIAPLAMVCHASPQTEGIAYTWWRAFFACLGLQVGQAVIVVGTVKVFLTPSGLVLLGVPATASGLLGVLVCVTMLWLLIKVPGVMKQFVLAPIGMQSQGRGLIGQLIQAFVMIKTLGAAVGLTGAAEAGGRAARVAPAARQRSTTSAARTGTRTARPVPAPGGRGARATTPRSAPSRPSPTGPVAFSNAPTTQMPLSVPAGTSGAPAFSHPAQPHTSAPAPTAAAPAAPFSQPSPAQPPSPRPNSSPPSVAFSNATPTAASPTPSGPAPAPTFSAPQAPQSALRRPPAPVTPVFSSAPPTPRTRPTAARRSAAASRSPGAGSSPPVTGTPATAPSPAARRAPQPAVPPPSRPRPTGSASPVFRPAPPPPAAPAPPSPSPAASSPPSPPPVRRSPRGGN